MPKKNKYTVGSVCSGIEAASIAWKPLGFKFEWFSEIADFPSKVLKEKYPRIKNIGNMVDIPDLLKNKKNKSTRYHLWWNSMSSVFLCWMEKWIK